MIYRSFTTCLFLSSTLTFCGCKKVAAPVRPFVAAGTGVIHGTIRFAGKKPLEKVIGGACCPGSTPVLDESLTIGENGAMKNCVVFITNAPNVDTGPMPDKVLTQKNCQYVPHVLAIEAGQNLLVTSHDPTIHNIHVEADINPAQNFSESQGSTHTLTFALPELIKFKCDVHPWMTAYAYVFDHPFFSVTDDNGQFTLDHLPPGTYTLVAWQEKLDPVQMQIVVNADKPAEMKFEFHGN